MKDWVIRHWCKNPKANAEIAERYALNLSVVLSETRPSQDEMRQVLETELRKMTEELTGKI